MKNELIFKPPVILIDDVQASLLYKEKALAYNISGYLTKKTRLHFFENKGLNIKKYIGEKMECVLEITDCEIFHESSSEIPKYAIEFDYKWTQGAFVFFPELVKLQEAMYNLELEEEDKLEEEFESYANDLFDNWGINGFNLEVYGQYPMLWSNNGIFLINEHQFEEELDEWSIDQKLFIVIKEAYLRGIRPHIPPEKQPPKLTEAQKAEQVRRQALHKERLKAYEEMQERIRIRRERGEGPSLV